MRIICIDPGHGGDDKGCQHNGIEESSYVLDFGLSLIRRINFPGYATILTRSDNSQVGLAKRAQIAEDVFADLTISLHVNSNDLREHGPIAFRLFGVGLAAAFGEAFDALCREKVGGEYVDGDRVRKMTTHHIIARPLSEHWTKRAFNVLCHHSSRPAVLIELGYSSNPEEAQALLTEERKGLMLDIIIESLQRAFEHG